MSTTSRNRITVCVACLFVSASFLHADQLQMQNGDRYEGKVLSVTAESVILQSDVLGKVTLPRNKVSQLSFGSGATTNRTTTAATPITPAPGTQAATNADISAALSGLGA